MGPAPWGPAPWGPAPRPDLHAHQAPGTRNTDKAFKCTGFASSCIILCNERHAHGHARSAHGEQHVLPPFASIPFPCRHMHLLVVLGVIQIMRPCPHGCSSPPHPWASSAHVAIQSAAAAAAPDAARRSPSPVASPRLACLPCSPRAVREQPLGPQSRRNHEVLTHGFQITRAVPWSAAPPS